MGMSLELHLCSSMHQFSLQIGLAMSAHYQASTHCLLMYTFKKHPHFCSFPITSVSEGRANILKKGSHY